MADYNVKQDALIRGTSVWARVGTSAADAREIGFCDSMRATKNLQLQRAQVCGSIMPASIDPQSMSVQISISGFLPTKNILADKPKMESLNGGGPLHLQNLNPNQVKFITQEQIDKHDYMDFYDKKSGLIIASFHSAIVSAFTVTVNGGSYIKADMTLEAIEMSGGEEYDS